MRMRDSYVLSAFAVTNLCTGGDWGLAIVTGILQTTSMHAIKQWEITLTIQLMGDKSPYLK
jgi:type IV secretory pathway TrbD component